MASGLAARRCVPCRGDTPPLRGEALARLLEQLGGGWRVVDEHHLEKEYRFPDFRSALAFTNRLGELAERENHHPDIQLAWGRVRLEIWTHVIGGLTESDFVFAAKGDELFEGSGL
jgi:4a-hydroxytetrahydrobiopterin dehydratase